MKKEKITKAFFAECVEQQKDGMFRLAYSILHNAEDAEDAVSEAVLRAWEKRMGLRDIARIRQWLMKIVWNVSKTMAVKRNRERSEADISLFTDRLAEKDTVHIELRLDLWQVVMGLKEEYKVVIILYYYSEFTVKEISSVLGVSEGTVKNRLFRAREKLRKIWIEERGSMS